MKKLLVFLLVIALAFAGVMTWAQLKDGRGTAVTEPAAAETATTELPADESDNAGPTEADLAGLSDMLGLSSSMPMYVLDGDKLFALHEPDEIVAVVDGVEIPWDMYCYWLSAAASDVENYMIMMSYYGETVEWTDPWNTGSDENFFEYVIRSAEESIKQIAVIENMAADLGLELSEESEAQIAETLEQSRIEAVGEDGTEEEYRAYMLEQGHVTPEFVERMTRLNYLYQESYQTYLSDSEAMVSEEEALSYLEGNAYIMANHILVETLEEAEELLAELREIEDEEELLARFAALKEEKDIDPGKVSYPDGYVFTEGEMEPAFDEAARALGEYELSEPVETGYGYHVILRLPLRADAVIDYASDGSPVTAREMIAEGAFTEAMDIRQANAELSYVEGFEVPNLARMLTELY